MLSIRENMRTVLEALAKAKRDPVGDAWVPAAQLQKDTGLSPADLNDAVEILVGNGLVKWLQSMGTAPYRFNQVTITSHGRLSLQ
jgi:hypothetical protein